MWRRSYQKEICKKIEKKNVEESEHYKKVVNKSILINKWKNYGPEGPNHSTQDLKCICQIRDNDLIYSTQLSQVPQKCGTFMLVPQVPQMWYKCGTKKGPPTFFGYFCIMHLIWPLMTSSYLLWPLVISKGQLHPKSIWIQHTYL